LTEHNIFNAFKFKQKKLKEANFTKKF